MALHSVVHIFYFKKPTTTKPRTDSGRLRGLSRSEGTSCGAAWPLLGWGGSQATIAVALRTREECWQSHLQLSTSAGLPGSVNDREHLNSLQEASNRSLETTLFPQLGHRFCDSPPLSWAK